MQSKTISVTEASLVFLMIVMVLVGKTSAARGPNFISEPQSQIDFSNTTGAWLDCEAQGIPTPTVSWVRVDGAKMEDVVGLRIILPNGTLFFPPFRAEEYRQDIHASVYRCIATNPIGVIVSRDTKVSAVVKQYYEAHVYDEFVIRGNTAVMRCHIPSFVQDYVIVTSWIRVEPSGAQSAIENGVRYSVFPDGALHIREVNQGDELRSYRCQTRHRLTGQMKISTTSGRLLVSDPKSSVPPRIIHAITSVEVEQGDSFELPCAAQGYPNPLYTWLKMKDNMMQTVMLGGRIKQLSGSLFIRNSQIDDGATYVCEVNNTVGVERSETIVTTSATLSTSIEPAHQQIDVGKPALFTCSITGYPVSAVEWLKDGRKLVNGGRIRFQTPEVLRIEPVQRDDRGMYQCFAKNKHGSAQGTAELKLGDATPIFQDFFAEQVLQPGRSVSLKCIISGNPPPQITWFLDDMALPKVPRYQLYEYISVQGDVISYVNISSVRTEDGGDYTCSGSNRVGKVSYSARINVTGPPFIRVMPNVTTVSGQVLILVCRVAGHPIRSVTWERDGSPLPVNHRQKVYPNGTLVVRNIQRPVDAGAYTCLANNHLGQGAKQNVYVTIISSPMISPFSFMPDLQEGMRAGVTCLITDGDRPISIKWIKDGRPIPSHLEVATRNLDEYTSTLVISNVRPRHNGNYTCVASNQASTVNSTARLLVNVPPRWRVEPKDSFVILSGTAILDCQADGFPIPNITWRKSQGKTQGDYKLINYLSGGMFIAENGSLLIRDVQDSDEAYYLCQASNGIGAELSKLAFLRVHIPAHFEVKRLNESVRKSNVAKLSCEARGDFPLTITWRKGDNTLDQHQDTRIAIKGTMTDTADMVTSELIIHKADRSDHAVFTCHAKNAYGSDEMYIRLFVLEKPEAPRKVQVMGQTSRSADIFWSSPYDGNTPILSYKVQFKTASDSWIHGARSTTVDGSTMSTTVGNLFAATRYEFRVFAENDIGSSNSSDIVSVTTLEEAPGGPPLSVRADAITSETLRIFWKPPQRELWNGDIEGYHIGYRMFESSDPYVFTTNKAKMGENEITIGNLAKHTKYGIVIEAYNRVGAGPRSPEIVASTREDVPSYPPQEVRCSTESSKSIRVEWAPPPSQFHHGLLQGYRVQYAAVDSPEETKESKATPQVRQSIDNLRSYTNYTIRVVAFTKAGDGIRSRTVYCRTEEDVPGAPADIKASVMSSDAILVTWRPPSNPNGIITKYTVYIRESGQEIQSTVDHSLPPTQLYYEARSLQEDSLYEFWVTASTVAGEGEKTRSASQSPVSTVPARIGSFPQRFMIYKKMDVRLPCRAVGIPTPDREWRLRDQKISENNRIRVEPDGSLYFANARSSDTGNYTCRVFNIYLSDQISHELIVKVKEEKESPPSPPLLKVTTITKSSLTLNWRIEDDGGSHVLFYTLNYKRETGDWHEIRIPADNYTYVINNLYCGTRYHIYMVAHNKDGSSAPSDAVDISTKGFSPIVPSQEILLSPNRTFITVNLDTWIDSGCRIHNFSIEYRAKANMDWISAAKEIGHSYRNFVIKDLEIGSWYDIRVIASGESGETIIEYEASTTDIHTGMDLADIRHEGQMRPLPFYLNLNIIIPLAVTILVIVLVSATVYYFAKRRHSLGYKRRDYRSKNDSLTQNKGNPNQSLRPPQQSDKIVSEGGQTYSTSPTHRPQSSGGTQDDISPYATYQLPGCVTAANDTGENVQLQTFSQSGSMIPHRHSQTQQSISSSAPYNKVLYSKVRKPRLSGLPEIQRYPNLAGLEPHLEVGGQQTSPNCSSSSPPPREILRLHPFIENAVAPSAPPAEYDSNVDSAIYNFDEVAIPTSGNSCCRNKALLRVPDLLHHRPDSSSSNETSSSPESDKQCTRTVERTAKLYNDERLAAQFTSRSDSRGSSLESTTGETNHPLNKTLGPPSGFADTQEIADAEADVRKQLKDAKVMDPARLAAAEEELIALLKRGSTSASKLRSSKDDFSVRV